MDHADYMRWQSRLHELSDAQARELANRLQQQRGIKAKPMDDSKDPTQDWLLWGMTTGMIDEQLLASSRRHSLRYTKAFVEYNKFAAGLRADLDQLLPGTDRDNERLVVSRLVARCVAGWLRRRHKIVSPAAILRNADAAFSALNEGFPGYAAAGMLGTVIQEELNGRGQPSAERAARVRQGDGGRR